MRILKILASIFFDENLRNISYEPKNLTEHYKKDLFWSNFLDEVCIGIQYKEIEQSIIHFKYDSRREYLAELLKALIVAKDASVLYSLYDDWVIVPVPMHWSRYLFRGFNHTKILSQEFAESLSLPLQSILSSSYRKKQSQLGRKMRLENKKNSFTIHNPKQESPKHIILIDDVVSSGATASECAKVLKENGAEVVIGWFVTSNNP